LRAKLDALIDLACADLLMETGASSTTSHPRDLDAAAFWCTHFRQMVG
jgi:hypothetical protein